MSKSGPLDGRSQAGPTRAECDPKLVADLLKKALEATAGVRSRLGDSESGPICRGCGRDLMFCNCNAIRPTDAARIIHTETPDGSALTLTITVRLPENTNTLELRRDWINKRLNLALSEFFKRNLDVTLTGTIELDVEPGSEYDSRDSSELGRSNPENSR